MKRRLDHITAGPRIRPHAQGANCQPETVAQRPCPATPRPAGSLFAHRTGTDVGAASRPVVARRRRGMPGCESDDRLKDMVDFWTAIRHQEEATDRVQAVLADEESAEDLDGGRMPADLRLALEDVLSATDAMLGATVRVMRWGDHDVTSIESVKRLRDAVLATGRRVLGSTGPAA